MKVNNKKGIEATTSTPSKQNTNLKVALAYARLLDFKVFPLHSIIHNKCSCNKSNCTDKGKHPAVKHGLKEATTNKEIITKWWTDRPHLNIGIATGLASGFFVLDVDTDINQDSGVTGLEALETLEKEHGELPETPYQITGSGGLHYLFKYVDGIRNKTNLFPSIDIRGDGGYIVASPSIHESGKQYNWELEHLPSETEIAEAPKWLTDSILPKKNGNKFQAKPVSEYIKILQSTNEGERNNNIMILIGHLIAKLDYQEAFEWIHIFNEARVNPPLDPNVITIAFNNVLKREAERR